MTTDVKRQPNLRLASALAGVLSGKAFANLQVELGPNVCYFPDRDVIQLPALPFGEMDPELCDDLLAYLTHEAAGERDETTWVKHWKTMDPPLRFIVNAMNDARIDALIMAKWPGAGLMLRRRVVKDMDEMLERGDCTTVTHLACALRYIGERVTTATEMREHIALLPRVEDIVATVDWTDEDDIVAKARAIWERLQEPPPPPPPPQPDEEEEQGQEQDAPPSAESGGEGEEEEGDEDADAEGDEEGEGDEAEGAEGDAGDDGPESEMSGGSSDTNDKGEEGDAEPAAGMGDAPLEAGDLKSMEEKLAERIAQALREQPEDSRASGRFSFPTHMVRVILPREMTCNKVWVPQQVARYLQLFTALRDAPGRVIATRQQYGELDLNLLPMALSGKSDEVHYRRVRAQSDQIAVHLSCDATGSISDNKAYLPMLASMGEALRRLSVPWSGTLWTGTADLEAGYTQNYATVLYRFREFSDTGPVKLPCTSSGAATVGFGANADMPGLLEAYSQLMSRPEPGKLCFFFTDGMPCLDFNRRQGDVLRNAMALTVRDMHRRGIDVVGIGVGMSSTSHRTMDAIFGKDFWVPIADASQVSVGFVRGVQAVVRRLRTGR